VDNNKREKARGAKNRACLPLLLLVAKSKPNTKHQTQQNETKE
jgi:hypothetical protein